MSPRRLRIGVLLLGAMLLLLGCTREVTTTLMESIKPPQVVQEARLHLPTNPSSLDPALITDATSLDLVGNLMEGLVRIADGVVEGAVAARWEWTREEQVTFYLRPEARWSDGRPVRAADFVDSWRRHLDADLASPHAHRLYGIQGAAAWNTGELAPGEFGAVALDDHTLQVTLKEPNPQWVSYTAHPAFFPYRSDQRLSSERLASGGAILVGNGPFRLVEWSTEGEIRLERNPYYWGAAQVQLERLTFRVEQDGHAALRLYEMGQLDHAVLPAELAVGLRTSQSMAQPSTMALFFNTGQPRLANRALRQAINLALDRERLALEVAGDSAVASRSLIPPSLAGGWQSPSGAHLGQADLVQARKLWESARAELKVEQVTLRLLHAKETTGLARSIQTMLQQNLDGLQVELHTVPFEQRLERVRYGQFDLVLQGLVADHDDPLSLLGLFTTANPANDARWIHSEYDQFIAQARRAEGQERIDLMVEAERLLLEEVPILPLYHPVRHWVVRSDLKGLRYRPLGARLDLRGGYREALTKAASR